jgi:hypothetical protein
MLSKVKNILAAVVVFFVFTACSGSKDFTGANKLIAGTPSPGWVWVPQYYVHDGESYRFVGGHYRKVLFRKSYFKRNLRGYTSKGNLEVK